MALTPKVKDELARVPVSQESAQSAEVAAILRFAGGLHLVAGRIVVEAELDSGAVARRLRGMIDSLFGHEPELQVLSPGGLRKTSRYIVRVAEGGEDLARRTGLVDRAGRPVRGLPPKVIGGTILDAEAAARSWPTVRSRSRADRRRSRSRARARRPRWRWSAAPVAWASPPRARKLAGETAWSSATERPSAHC